MGTLITLYMVHKFKIDIADQFINVRRLDSHTVEIVFCVYYILNYDLPLDSRLCAQHFDYFLQYNFKSDRWAVNNK